jgi:hypothetical protein
MDTIQPPTHISNDNIQFFRKRYNPTIALVVALLLFLLPFAKIKCSTYTVAENTGIGLATGKQWKVSFMGIDNSLVKDLGDMGKANQQRDWNTRPNWFLLLAVIFGICGLIFSFFNSPVRAMAVMWAGVLAVLMMVAAIIHIKLSMKTKIPTGGNRSDNLDLSMAGLIKVNFTVWFFLSMAVFAVAAFFSYKHYKIELQDKIDGMVQFEFQHNQADDANG